MNLKLTKFLTKPNLHIRSGLVADMLFAVDNFERVYLQREEYIQRISVALKYHSHIMKIDSESIKYYSCSLYNGDYVKTYCLLNHSLSDIKNLRLLSHQQIDLIHKYVEYRDLYYHYKFQKNKTRYEEFCNQLENEMINMEFMEDLFDNIFEMIKIEKRKTNKNYKDEITRLFDVNIEFLDYQVLKDIYTMYIYNDQRIYAKYDIGTLNEYAWRDIRICRFTLEMIQKSYITYEIRSRLLNPILQCAMLCIDDELSFLVENSGDENELSNQINETIMYITSE